MYKGGLVLPFSTSMYNVNINIDVAAVLHQVGTALLHAYRKIHVSVPATLEATEVDLTDVVSIVGKCAPTQEELDDLNREFITVRQDEAALECAAPWGFRAIKRAFHIKARAHRMKVHAVRIATNAKFRGLFGGMKRTLTKTATKTAAVLGPIIGIPLPEVQDRSAPQSDPPFSRNSESTLRNPPTTSPTVLAADLLASKRAAPPCSCAAVVLRLNPTPRDMSTLIAGLSQGIIDAQAKTATTNAEACCNPNEAALAQLVVSLIQAQATRPLGVGTVPQAPELALIEGLAALFASVPSSIIVPPIDIPAPPVAVACR
ncbi:hypothetical protein C8R44DRAFT_847001 [Mycena epipterygia]|nr:hypothetical protein C8R44DRAFT_847001 [Mycena epipterygia]